MSRHPAAFGLIAEFATPEAVTKAALAARRQGYRALDVFSPFPLTELDRELVRNAWLVPVLAAGASIVGAVIFYALQYWMNVVDYPINVGGRPLHSWPAFVPATIIVAIFWGAAAALIGMLIINGLPRLHHPVFAAPGFERATQDRFFLLISSDDPRFDRRKTAALLERFHPESVSELKP